MFLKPANPPPADNPSWAEVRTILHEELAALPERLRGPLVLCYLEGMTQDQSAAELGLPKGTLKGRLERGRERLRTRLVRRGLGPAATLLASAWPGADLTAELPGALVETSARIASGKLPQRVAILFNGVTRSMFLSKVKTAAGILALAGIACIGVTTFAVHAWQSTDKPEDRRPVATDAARASQHWRDWPTIPQQTGPVHALAFSADGKTLAVGLTKIRLADATVMHEGTLYDSATGKELGGVSGSLVAFSADGKMLAAAGGDGNVWLSDRGPGGKLRFLKGMSDEVLCLAFSPDSKTIAAGSGNPSKPTNPGMVRIWDVESGVERVTQTHAGRRVRRGVRGGRQETPISLFRS